jgi:hypothetical protein
MGPHVRLVTVRSTGIVSSPPRRSRVLKKTIGTMRVAVASTRMLARTGSGLIIANSNPARLAANVQNDQTRSADATFIAAPH